jgi:hypothetical protein
MASPLAREIARASLLLAALGCAVDDRGVGIAQLSTAGASGADGTGGSSDAREVVGAAGGAVAGAGNSLAAGGSASAGDAPGLLRSASVAQDFGLVELQGTPAEFSWVLENAGDLPLGPITLTSTSSEFGLENGCTGSLEGHGSCEIQVRFAPSSVGLKTAELSASSGSSSLPLLVTGTGAIRLDLVRSGGGAGEVLSDPPGINCGGTCSALFTSSSVRLLARTTNGSNAFFSGWSAPECAGPGRECTLNLAAPRSITATFQPMQSNLVFLSSIATRPDLGSVEAYDAMCNRLATEAGINDQAGTGYLAALSSSNLDVRTRLTSIGTGWTRMDGRPFAANAAALLDQNRVLYPIRYDERGGDQLTTAANPDVYVMTGSNPDGTVSPFTCNDWADATANAQTDIGYPTGGPTAWSTTIPIACNAVPYHVACFGRTRTGAVPIASFTGKRVWLSNTPFVPGGLSPDQQCTADRPAGVSAGRALLPYSVQPGAAVLDLNANYVRTDGQLVGTGQQIFDQQPLSGIWLHGNGQPETAVLARAWSGDRDFNERLSAAETCDDWTSPAQTGFAGYVQTAEPTFFWGFGVPQPCSNTFHYLYCVEP